MRYQVAHTLPAPPQLLTYRILDLSARRRPECWARCASYGSISGSPIAGFAVILFSTALCHTKRSTRFASQRSGRGTFPPLLHELGSRVTKRYAVRRFLIWDRNPRPYPQHHGKPLNRFSPTWWTPAIHEWCLRSLSAEKSWLEDLPRLLKRNHWTHHRRPHHRHKT